jgi:hypothetical protein
MADSRILEGFEATETEGRFVMHFVDDAGETVEIEASRENVELVIRHLQALLTPPTP